MHISKSYLKIKANYLLMTIPTNLEVVMEVTLDFIMG